MSVERIFSLHSSGLSVGSDSLRTESPGLDHGAWLKSRNSTKLNGENWSLSDLCSSPDERHVALGCRGAFLQLYDSSNLAIDQPKAILKGCEDKSDVIVGSISWRGNAIAAGTDVGTYIWSTEEQQLLGKIFGEGTSDVSFNGDNDRGLVLATCASEPNVKVWDLRQLGSVTESSTAQRILRDHHGRKFRKARWSPGEPYLATIHARDVWIWDMRLTERPCTILSAPGSFNVIDVDWSPRNFEKLISINAAGIMHMWNSRTPKLPICAQFTYRSSLAAYARDGNSLFAFGEPGTTFRVFDAYNLSRVHELYCYDAKVRSFDFISARSVHDSMLAVLHADSTVSIVDPPLKEIKKCRGEQYSPSSAFRDGIFKGSLQNSFAYCIAEPQSVMRSVNNSSNVQPESDREAYSSAGSPLPMRKFSSGSSLNRNRSDNECQDAMTMQGPKRCGISFSRTGQIVIFSMSRGEDEEAMTKWTENMRIDTPRLTYFLTGDEHLHIPVEDDHSFVDAVAQISVAAGEQSSLRRVVQLISAQDRLGDLLQDSLGGYYELLRGSGSTITKDDVVRACTRNAEVASKHSEAEISSVWRLAAVALNEDPNICPFAAVLLTNIAEQLEKSSAIERRMRETAAFFKCVCAALPSKPKKHPPDHAAACYQRAVLEEGQRIRARLRRGGATSVT